jgi:hypothetical protein
MKLEKKSIIQKDLYKNEGENKKKKPLIWGKIRVFNWRVKLNWKIVVTKEKTNQKNDGQIEKKKEQKLWLNDKIKSKKTSTKGPREKN